MKHLTFLSLIVVFFAFPRIANSETTTAVKNPSASSSVQAKSPLERPLKDVLKEFPMLREMRNRLSPHGSWKPHPESVSFVRCDVYFKDDGTLGQVGKTAKEVLKDPRFAILKTPLSHSDVSKVCPNFGRMNDEQRTAFWIWVMAGNEYRETACGKGVSPRVKYGDIRARMPTVSKGRLSAPTNDFKAYAPFCDETKSDRGQLTCAFSHILRQLNRSERSELFSSRSYFEDLRPKGDGHADLRSFIAAYPVCGN